MEFMNVGGGELLVIILLALVLFSPEDILKLMRSIGNYARTARQMWSNVSKTLQSEYIPDDVKEVVSETAKTVKQARATLTDVRQQFNEITTSVEEEVSDVTKLADKEVTAAVSTVNENQVSKESGDEELDNSTQALPETDDTMIDSEILPGKETILPVEKINASKSADALSENQDVVESPDSQATEIKSDEISADTQPVIEQNTVTPLTKEETTKTQDVKSIVNTSTVNMKLAKVAENTLKDDLNGS